MDADVPAGVLNLAVALRDMRDEFTLDSAAATVICSDGHALTLRWSGEVLEIERDDGNVVLVNVAGMVA